MYCKLLLISFSLVFFSCNSESVNIIVEVSTSHLVIAINNKGNIDNLTDKTTRKNHLATDTLTSLLSLRINHQFYPPQSACVQEDVLTLYYEYDIKAEVKVEEAPSYLTFELISLNKKDTVDLVLWGPYHTTIGNVIGETVGVVRSEEYAIGIQALNIKTLGGYPWNESDRMPAFDIFSQEDIDNMHPDADGSVLYRVEAAKPTLSGSSLQSYSRNRTKERIIEEFNHKMMVAPPYQDGGVIGSKIALFGCPVEEVLDHIESIELAEGLPHPMIDGEWVKRSRKAAAAYIITNFTEETIDEAIEITQKAGLNYLYHYGKTFENWGQFDLYKGAFPNGRAGFKKCVDLAAAQGIKMGSHVLSNFITTNDPYVTPVPDDRLAIIGSSKITTDINASETEIPIDSPDFFNQMANNNLKTVRIGDELVQYGKVSESTPWMLLDCQRGAFNTIRSDHKSGTEISKLQDHGYKVFLTNADLTIEMSETIADLWNETGLRQISFDGLEGNRSTGLGTYGESLMPYTWYNNLTDELKEHIIIDASRTTHFFWHIYSRMNWGEPWYGGFRESQTEYRFKNQAYFQRNYMPGMLGWFKMTAETSIEDAEWLLARSAGYDAGYAFVVGENVIEENGHSNQILELIGQWEKLRIGDTFSESQKEILRDNEREFSLVKIDDNKWELQHINNEIFRHENKKKQPGEPLHTTLSFINDGELQSMKFAITAIDVEVDNPSIEIDNYKKIKLPIVLQKGEILKYEGGEQATIYTKNWEVIRELAINPSDFELDSGEHTISVNCDFKNTDDEAYLKVEVRMIGHREVVAKD
ncbi:MAG: hypothetical protein HKN68_09605 [Saprospiraceae bacterium]|nr:hypothetical protein [Saprospiraceae bacterium]